MTPSNEDIDYSEDNWDEEENELLDCPKCQKEYDEIDAEYEICSYCGWNVSKQKYNGQISKTDFDIL